MSNQKVIIDGKNLELSNLEKVYWPKEKYTKGDLINYYQSISKYILPHLAGRPESLNRFPNGIEGESFYQKNIENEPDWLETYAEKAGDGHTVKYAIANDAAALVYLVNLGCIEMNVWNSRKGKPEHPDFLVIDLDPVGIEFAEVLKASLEVKKVFDKFGIKSYPKTSGKRGMHIYVPTGAKYTYGQVRDFAYLVVLSVHEILPKTTSLERNPKNRHGKVYLDYLQNRKEATMAAPYSVRPVPGAFVSTPVLWQEISKGVKPEDFTLKNTPARLKRVGDIFAPILSKTIDLGGSIKIFENLKRKEEK